MLRLFHPSRLAMTLWLLAFTPALAEQQQQQWYQIYYDARELVKKQQWRAAEEKLQEAIRLNPNSGRNVQQGRSRDDYFPEYYLGVVYLKTSRPDLAIAE